MNMLQHRWLELLKNYDISILYQPGKANAVAAALSRKALVWQLGILEGGVETVSLGGSVTFSTANSIGYFSSSQHFSFCRGLVFIAYLGVCLPL